VPKGKKKKLSSSQPA